MTSADAPAWVRYELARPAEIEAARRAAPLAYVPWGALEWHSWHNPIGLDGIKAQGLCEALAARTGGVVLPPVYVGTDTIKSLKGFPHTLEHRPDTVRDLCGELLDQLADEGFEGIVVVTGHYAGGQVQALGDACDAFRARHPGVAVWMMPNWEPLEGRYPPDHAALGETSYQLHFAADSVDLSRLPPDRVATLDDDGVFGDDPRNATAELGAQMVDAFVEACLPRLRAMLERDRR